MLDVYGNVDSLEMVEKVKILKCLIFRYVVRIKVNRIGVQLMLRTALEYRIIIKWICYTL